jgi:hypothetical protein
MGRASANTSVEQPNALVCSVRTKGPCLACGEVPIPKGKRRYCSDKCKRRLDFALFICTGLVQALRARYAAFSYTGKTLVLDVLPSGSRVISRFVWRRSGNKKVADELLDMVVEAGREWYEIEEETGSAWWASQRLLDRASREDIPVTVVVPAERQTPQLNRKEQSALRLLKLTKKQILSENSIQQLKAAYRRTAKLHHPDKGGEGRVFAQINEAHAELLNWAQNPKFYSRAALPNSWCYDSSKNRWAPPA